MGNFTVKTRRLIVWGVILLACVGALMGEKDIVLLSIGGLLGLIKSDEE